VALIPHLKAEDSKPIVERLQEAAGMGKAAQRARGRVSGQGGDGYLVGNAQTKAWLKQFKFI
jgi:hypothetical protein